MRRKERLEKLIREEIGKFIYKGITDPRIGFATVTDVDLSGDLRSARVFVSVYGEEGKDSPTLSALKDASKTIRRELSRCIRVRHFPELRFVRDRSIERSVSVIETLDRIGREK